MKKCAKWIWLSQMCGQGSADALTLVEKFDSIDAIYAADFEAYSDIGISERLCEDLCDKSLDRAASVISYCQTSGVHILCYDDAEYPVSLRTLKDSPVVLYYVGELPDFNRDLCIAVVGTRKMSEYGMRAAYKIAYEIASSGAVVISGMALGIDGVASAAAIAAAGRTVAVLGCGIDVVYPRSHSRLKELIAHHGAVITEYPPSTEPKGSNFPVRNRIISGLSQGTVIIDADIGSGAMITAKNAILQGRDIYAVPSNIDSENSSGTNSLIRDGAQAVLCGNDVINNYAFVYRDRLNVQKMRAAERRSEFDSRVLSDMGVGTGALRVRTSNVERLVKDRTVVGEMKKAASIAKSPHGYAEKAARTESISMSAVSRKGDESSAALASLSEKQRKIFDEMPLDRAVTVDYLTKTGYKLGEVISALTVLEIKGLVSSLPGALYVRK